MNFNKDYIIKEFNLKPFGVKGWMRSDLLVCPNCGQNDEFAILFTKNGGIMHCLHGKTCNKYRTSLYNYLKHVGKLNFFEYEKAIKLDEFPSFGEPEMVKEEIKELPIKKLPIGFKRINYDSYLNSRNFLKEHYELFKVGETRLDPSLRDHLVFQFFNDNGECIGWMSRSKKPKGWHDNNLIKYKEGVSELHLRYNNSPNTDFGSILGGCNEITSKTDTLILVEGITDKVNVDSKLGLLYSDDIKCCFTFGNKISFNQISIINKFCNIKNIYLLYDGGTINESKRSGLMILSNIKNGNVFVCDIKDKSLDPGVMDEGMLLEVLEKSVNCFSFNYGKIDGIT